MKAEAKRNPDRARKTTAKARSKVTTPREDRSKRKVPELPLGGVTRTFELIRAAHHLYSVLRDLFRHLDDFIKSDPLPSPVFSRDSSFETFSAVLATIGLDFRESDPAMLREMAREMLLVAATTDPEPDDEDVVDDFVWIRNSTGRLARELTRAEKDERVRALCLLAKFVDSRKGSIGLATPLYNVLHDLEFLEPVLESHFSHCHSKHGSDSRALTIDLVRFTGDLVAIWSASSEKERRGKRIERIDEIVQQVAARRSDGWPDSLGSTTRKVAEAIDTDLGMVERGKLRNLVRAQRVYTHLAERSSATLPPHRHRATPKGPLRVLLENCVAPPERKINGVPVALGDKKHGNYWKPLVGFPVCD